MNLLTEFQEAFGQLVNLAKSTIFFSHNTLTPICIQIFGLMNIAEVDATSSYLGLTNILGKNKVAIFWFLRDKRLKRINSRVCHFLSREGKELYLKTVAQAIPSFAMSVYIVESPRIGVCPKG